MNSFKKYFNNIKKYHIIKQLTGNLGKVVEDDEKITCYVKESKLKKKAFCYAVSLSGINENQKNYELVKAFQLDKPVCYILDGINLKKDDRIYHIFGKHNCEIIIKNCNFESDMTAKIKVDGKCTLDNTNITAYLTLEIDANDLTIKNMDSDNIKIYSSYPHISFGADNKIEIINSNIRYQNKNIFISAMNKINVVNSKIVGKQIGCYSNTINADESSSLIATDKVKLHTNNFNSINIDAPTIDLNGEEMSNEKKSVTLKQITKPLTLKRLELVNLLKKVKTQCENIISEKNSKYQKELSEKVSKYQEELKAQPISKVLKK